MEDQEQTAFQLKEAAINLMESKDYKGAWRTLNQAKMLFPALRNLNHMLFVCNILQKVDVSKPNYGVNWLQALRIPQLAHTSAIKSKFRQFINWIDAIKTEFPGTDTAQRLLTDAMEIICNGDKNKHVEAQPVVSEMGSSKDVSNTKSTGVLKRKIPVVDYSNRRVARGCLFMKKNEIADSPVVSKELVLDRKCSDVYDHFLLRECQVSNKVEKCEGELVDEMKIVKPDSQISETAGSKVVDEAVEDDGEIELVYSDRQATETLGQSLNPNLKDSLFEAIPQSPHYSFLNGMSLEFRKPIITAIETSFVVVADQIQDLVAAEDVTWSKDKISNQLMYLESMGYNVQKLRARLDELNRLAEWKQVSLKACQEDDNELKEWKAQRETFEAKNRMINFLIAEHKRELTRLEESLAANESVIKFQKVKKAEIQHQRDKRMEECRWLDSKIESTAKSPW